VAEKEAVLAGRLELHLNQTVPRKGRPAAAADPECFVGFEKVKKTKRQH
jgi:hypothetical protein